MKVKDLIVKLLDCDMDDEVEVLLRKGKTIQIFQVHKGDNNGYIHSGVYCVALEPMDDLQSIED